MLHPFKLEPHLVMMENTFFSMARRFVLGCVRLSHSTSSTLWACQRSVPGTDCNVSNVLFPDCGSSTSIPWGLGLGTRLLIGRPESVHGILSYLQNYH